MLRAPAFCSACAHAAHALESRLAEAEARVLSLVAASAVAAELELSRGELLDYAFLTFRTSAQKSGVLLAAKAGTRFTSAGPPKS